MQKPGEPCGNGLTKQAAAELGLREGTAVGAALLDAHAGALGEMECSVMGEIALVLLNQMGGTQHKACNRPRRLKATNSFAIR